MLFVAAVPVALMPLPYPTPLHAIEAALLVNALAFQARGRLAAALVLATVAVFIKPGLAYFHGLALVLLVGVGLLMQSFVRLRAVDPGFDSERLLSFRLALPPSRYAEEAKTLVFYEALLARLAALPGAGPVATVVSLCKGNGGGPGAPAEAAWRSFSGAGAEPAPSHHSAVSSCW